MKKKKLIIKSIISVSFVLIFIFLCVIKNNTTYAEWYTNNISTKYISFMSKITSNIPFSLYEWIFIILVILAIYFVVSIIVKLCKKQFYKSLNKFLSLFIVTFLVTNIYVATASISYGKESLYVPQYDQEVSDEFIDQTFDYFLEDYNEISTHFDRNEDGTIISPYTFEELNNILINEYKRLDPNYYSSFTPNVKKLTFSNVFTELHITGVFFAPTGEANINKDISSVELPHTMAHEMAHSKGIFRENDANLLAMYITLSSDNEYLRYSSYYHNFSSLLRIYAQTNYDKYVKQFNRLNKDIVKEYATLNKFWSEHDLLSKVGTFFNDLFLKLNGNKNGVNDYEDNSKGEDSEKKDENDQPIYVIKNHSTYAKLFFYLYNEEKNNK